MNDVGRIAVCVAISIGAHVAFTEGLGSLPPHKDASPPEKVTVRVIEPPPEPPPEPAKPPPPAEVTPAPAPTVTPKIAEVKPHPHPQHVDAPVQPTVTKEAPHGTPGPGVGVGGPPRFGGTLDSTSQGGSGMPLPTGNSLGPVAGNEPDDQGAGAQKHVGGGAPVADYQATKKPLPEGRCVGKYTADARSAGVEGQVVLELTVDADGKTRDVHVVSEKKLGHGLEEAALAALRACHFTPGEVDGKPVAVRIRGFKVSFYLQDAD